MALLVVAADQYTKHIVATTFMPEESRIVIPHVVYLTYVQNSHGAFGLFGSHPLLLAAFASAVLIGFFLWYRSTGNAGMTTHIAFGLILGGAIGNIADRMRLAYVVDFIDLRWWPVFNVADSAISIGVILLLLRMLIHEKKALPAQ
ncbi:MAG TPA: signal peptidase II [Candidatus Eremiobacteraceae bacterium]|nr:signal peptidase II [Candidatus Eremiobacteraceae bacterium]